MLISSNIDVCISSHLPLHKPTLGYATTNNFFIKPTLLALQKANKICHQSGMNTKSYLSTNPFLRLS